jgi:hypothetical protein
MNEQECGKATTEKQSDTEGKEEKKRRRVDEGGL